MISWLIIRPHITSTSKRHKRLNVALAKFRAARDEFGFRKSGGQRKERTTDEHGKTKVGEAGAVRRARSASSPGEPRFGQISRELWRRSPDRRRPVALQPCRSEGARPIVHVQLGARDRGEPDAGGFRLVPAAARRVELSSLSGRWLYPRDVRTDRALPGQTSSAIAERHRLSPRLRGENTFHRRYSLLENRSKIPN
jgi:hypothetical protein